jgi:hypothetical protein
MIVTACIVAYLAACLVAWSFCVVAGDADKRAGLK